MRAVEPRAADKTRMMFHQLCKMNHLPTPVWAGKCQDMGRGCFHLSARTA